MSDYELENLEPQEPEIEYTWQRSWDEHSYGTGSTTPPKDHGAALAVLLILVILLSGTLSWLNILNIELFQVSGFETEEITSIKFTKVTSVVPAGLEENTNSSGQDISTGQPVTDAGIELSGTPSGLENDGESAQLSWQEVYEKAIPSVVSITCTSGSSTSSGTGVVMTAEGYLITNAHVVEDASYIEVLLTDGRVFEARCIGMDDISDLAVLHINAEDLTPATFGDSGNLRVGDDVVAIGDPLGVELRGTMTDGIISAINRDLMVNGRTMTLIQTTAALNAGNSGGPLVNCYGQVVGINTMKIGDYASTSGVEGLGFAIPTTIVKTVVEQLLTQGYVSGRPTLGIDGEMLSNFYQLYYHLPLGLLVSSVEPESDAAAKGIEAGDIILAVNGVSITSKSVLSELIFGCGIGDQVQVTIYRGGKEYTYTVTIIENKG